METVPFTEMLCFLGVLDSGKCLQTESLTYFIKIHSVIRCICKIVKSDYYLHHVCPLGVAQFPIEVFSWISFLENLFRKFKFHYSQARIKVTLLEDNIHFLSYLAHLLIEWEIFQTKFVKKIKPHFILSNLVFKK